MSSWISMVNGSKFKLNTLGMVSFVTQNTKFKISLFCECSIFLSFAFFEKCFCWCHQ